MSSREMKEKQTELYRYFDKKGTLLYVGISLNAVSRAAQHRIASFWYKNASSITIERFPNRQSALNAEKEAIQKENPVHNVYYNSYKYKNEEMENFETNANFDRKNLLGRTVVYKPIYTQKEAGEIIFGNSSDASKKVKNLIEEGKMQGVLVSKRERLINTGEKRTIKKYMVTGWQLIEFIEALEEGQTSL